MLCKDVEPFNRFPGGQAGALDTCSGRGVAHGGGTCRARGSRPEVPPVQRGLDPRSSTCLSCLLLGGEHRGGGDHAQERPPPKTGVNKIRTGDPEVHKTRTRHHEAVERLPGM